MVSESVYRPVSDVVTRKVGDESVIVPVRSHVADLDAVVTLNPVAARIWDLLDGHRDVGAIVGTICEEYEVEPGTARADVDEFIQSLEEAKLVERVGGSR
jgi:hypothetical protein